MRLRGGGEAPEGEAVAAPAADSPQAKKERRPTSEELDAQRKLKNMKTQRQRAKQIHWRARQPARKLTEAERSEIQSRLYTDTSPQASPQRVARPTTARVETTTQRVTRCCSAASAASRPQVDLSPSAMAAATKTPIEHVIPLAARVPRRAKSSRVAQRGASSPDGPKGGGAGGGGGGGSSGQEKREQPPRQKAASGWKARDGALPDGWKSATADDGRVYYYDGAGQTQWEHPGGGGGDGEGSQSTERSTKRVESTVRNAASTRRNGAPSTRRSTRTSREADASSSRSRPRTTRDYWNVDYQPTAVGTSPIPVALHETSWVGIGRDSSQQSRGMERRMANPSANIECLGGGRTAQSKEAGPPRVAQQWKEGLRSIVPDQLTAKEREVEELRTLLRRGGGIGTPNDQWTPYTGPSEAEVLQKAVAGYWQDVDTIESSDGSRR